jgi:hypothetical protein
MPLTSRGRSTLRSLTRASRLPYSRRRVVQETVREINAKAFIDLTVESATTHQLASHFNVSQQILGGTTPRRVLGATADCLLHIR